MLLRKILKITFKSGVEFARLIYSLVVIIFISLVAYVLGGYPFLSYGLWGTDMWMAYSLADWVDKYFPHVPFWYPSAGGGISLTHSYPMLAFYLVAFLKRLTAWDLSQTFSMLVFASIPLMALGIYGFVVIKFKNQTAALLASLFYLVSPITWTWLYDWGFYAESVSLIFVMPTVIFWDLFFTKAVEGKQHIATRFYFLLTVICLSLALLSHFGTGLSLIGWFTIYILAFIFRKKIDMRIRIRSSLVLLMVGLLTIGLTAFNIFPFNRYNKIASIAGISGYKSSEEIRAGAYSLWQVLGFQIPKQGDFLFAHKNIAFPKFVSILAILGAGLSLLNPAAAALGIYAVFALVCCLNPNFIIWISYHLPSFMVIMFGNRYVLIILKFIIPTLAALSVFWLWERLFFWLKNHFGQMLVKILALPVALILIGFIFIKFGNFSSQGRFVYQLGQDMIVIDIRNIWRRARTICFTKDNCVNNGSQDLCFNNEWLSLVQDLYPDKDQWCHSELTAYFDAMGVRDWCHNMEIYNPGVVLPAICNLNKLDKLTIIRYWNECRDNKGWGYDFCKLRYDAWWRQLSPPNWPPLVVKKIDQEKDQELKMISNNLKVMEAESPQARLGFAQSLGSAVMKVPLLLTNTNLSQLYFYAVPSILNRRFWQQQVDAFYLDTDSGPLTSQRITELTRWFGLNYLFAGNDFDAKRFSNTGWQAEADNQKVWKFLPENFLADLSQKTAILVIGQERLKSYDQVFKLATMGILPYDQAILFWGKENIDDYSLEELESFDGLILHGYNYHDQTKANALLRNYVNQGGLLYLGTGWQYSNPDWQTKANQPTLDVIPLKQLVWKNFGKTPQLALEDKDLGRNIDVTKFSPFVYQGQPWAVSVGERSNLKDWAQVVLSIQGYPLVVKGQLGKGKIVWSGMNSIPHLLQEGPISSEEINFFTSLSSWLLESKPNKKFAIDYHRFNPDKIEFTINESIDSLSVLLWKEAFFPDFKASLIKKNNQPIISLPIYRAGPSLVAMRLPRVNQGDKVRYQYQQPLIEKMFYWLSVITLLFLFFIILEGIFLGKKSYLLAGLQTLEVKLVLVFKRLCQNPLKWLKEEES